MLPLKRKNIPFFNQTTRIAITLSILVFFMSSLHGQVRIKMKKENGVYTTPCKVNGLKLRFIFDTGASNVSLSLTEALFMLKNGYLDETDLQGSSYSQIANGDIVENTSVTLKEIEIGGLKLHNIEAVIIHELTAPLLLGQSAINKLGKIQLEGNELVIINAISTSGNNSCQEAISLIKEADKYYSERLNSISSATYQKAYDLCPEALTCWDIYSMGSAYEYVNNYVQSSKYLEKASNCIDSKKTLYWIYIGLGNSYIGLDELDKASVNIEKALFLASDDELRFFCYGDLAFISSAKENFHKAIDYYEKRIEYYLKYKSITKYSVLTGEVKDDALGEKYWNISNNYHRLSMFKKAEYHLLISALCGYDQAIEDCIKYGFDYQEFKEWNKKEH